jgi:hypothetical protein
LEKYSLALLAIGVQATIAEFGASQASGASEKAKV